MALGRAFPIRAHLPKGPQGLPPLPSARIVSAAKRRPYIGRQVIPAHVAKPIVSVYVPPGFIAPRAKIVSHQARFRALIGRTPPHPHLPKAGPLPPLPGGRIVSAARRRPYVERLPKRPHLAGPILGTPPEIAVLITGTTVFRPLPNSLQSRFVPPTLILPELLGFAKTGSSSPVPPGTFVSAVVRSRQAMDRRRGRTILPRSAHPGPLPVGNIVSTAVQAARSRTGRAGHVHLPSANLVPAGPGAKLVLTAVASARAQLARSGKIQHARPITGVSSPQPPVASGTIVSQATKRPYVGRMPLRPRLPYLGATGPAITKKITVHGQAIRRTTANRSVPTPHLAKPIIFPFIPPVYVLKYVKRRTTGISPLKALTAPPIIGAAVVSGPIVTRPYVVSQALSRRAFLRPTPAPHLPTHLAPSGFRPRPSIGPILSPGITVGSVPADPYSLNPEVPL